MASLTRLDPIPSIYQLRVYDTAGDSSKPIAEEMREYVLIATVTIVDDKAHVTGAHGDLSPAAQRDLKKELAMRGVRELHWERHYKGNIYTKKMRIKPC